MNGANKSSNQYDCLPYVRPNKSIQQLNATHSNVYFIYAPTQQCEFWIEATIKSLTCHIFLVHVCSLFHNNQYNNS